MLEGKLGALGSRMARLLFKLAVEQELNVSIISQNIWNRSGWRLPAPCWMTA